MKPGDKVFVVYEGSGVIVDICPDCIHVKIDSDGVIVAASHTQVYPL